MSDFAETCDWFLEDLEAVLPGVATHRYAPWDPERLTNDGERHIAVWPAGEVETSEGFTTHGRLLRQTYRVAYWEPGGSEDERQVVDEAAASDLLDLHNAIRERFFILANRPSNTLVAYQATSFPEFSSPVRFFILTINVDRPKDLT